MAFIGASSAAAAFFFLMARRFIPFIAFAFLRMLRVLVLGKTSYRPERAPSRGEGRYRSGPTVTWDIVGPEK